MITSYQKKVALIAAASMLLLPAIALAVDPLTWFQQIIGRLLSIVILPIFSGIVVIMFLWAGYLFVTAQGDPTKISAAKKALIWAVIGVAVALLSYSVVNFVEYIFQEGGNVLNNGGVGGGNLLP